MRQILTRKPVSVLARNGAPFLPAWARVLLRGEMRRDISIVGDLP